MYYNGKILDVNGNALTSIKFIFTKNLQYSLNGDSTLVALSCVQYGRVSLAVSVIIYSPCLTWKFCGLMMFPGGTHKEFEVPVIVISSMYRSHFPFATSIGQLKSTENT